MRVRRANDSSKTRVGPVFDALLHTVPDWPRRLLDLSALPDRPHSWDSEDLKPISCYWQSKDRPWKEKALSPPLSLLEFLVRGAKLPTAGMPKAHESTMRDAKNCVIRTPTHWPRRLKD